MESRLTEPLSPGTRIAGRYRVVRYLGPGHPGVVYLAEQEALGRQVVVKLLRPDPTDPEAGSRFEREAAALSRLSHPACAEVFDYGQWEGRMFLALRYVDGPRLAGLLGERWEPVEALTLMIDVAEGLAHAHARGIVHRNLAPERVVLVPGRRERRAARMVDFGLVRLHQDDLDTTIGRKPQGTPGFMAPERVRGEPGDARVDVYAAGILLYTMLVGAHPFERPTTSGMMVAQTQEAVPRLDEVDPPLNVSPALVRVVERATAWNPQARFDDGRELARALRAARLTLADPSLASIDLDVQKGKVVVPPKLEARLDDATPTLAMDRAAAPPVFEDPERMPPPPIEEEPAPEPSGVSSRQVLGLVVALAVVFVLAVGTIAVALWVAGFFVQA